MDYAIQNTRGKLIGRKVDTLSAGSLVCLKKGELFCLEGDPRGTIVYVMEGIAWLTQAGDAADVLLEKGQTYQSIRRGKVLLQGLPAARINLIESRVPILIQYEVQTHMTLPLYQVDAFTNRPFLGNPAGVVLLNAPRPDAWMLNVAREMNLSETAFLLPEGEGYRLRWFTPVVEVTLCGHATLASAHILWEQGYLSQDETAKFETLSGLLTAERTPDGWIALNFPARASESVKPPEGLLEALGIQRAAFTGKYKEDYLVEVDSEAAVRALKPDFARLRQIKTRGVVVTARASSEEYQVVSRFFAPAVGVDEDPVTGSAHCALAPYWSAKLNRSEMLAYQASSRGGLLRIRHGGERVILEGQAVTVFSASLLA